MTTKYIIQHPDAIHYLTDTDDGGWNWTNNKEQAYQWAFKESAIECTSILSIPQDCIQEIK